jgi:nucleoid DNA-binding protein
MLKPAAGASRQGRRDLSDQEREGNMRQRHWWALGGLLGAMALVLAATPTVHSQKPKEKEEEGFVQRAAKKANLDKEDAARFFQALGPEISRDLAAGRTVSLPGLGTFRVVRVAEHRDLRGGRPVTIPAVNTVEFLANEGLIDAANSDSAVPAEVVPAFEFVPLPDRDPGQKMPLTRNPGRRTP